jgi:deazaflavin-dependent oxidoreductase (nitroreductase family)
MRFINSIIFSLFRHRNFFGGRLLKLTTVGARSGEQRTSTLAYFPDVDGTSWIIIGSANGAAKHPAWIFNLAKHPDQVWAELDNRKIKVTPVTLTGDERAQTWKRVVAQAPSYAGYETKTDRDIPVVRLSPAAG